MKEPYLSQKHHIVIKLKMARSGQGWWRLKILLIFLSAKIRSRSSSRQTFGATELGSPIISTSRSLMSITNMAPACQESGLTQGLSVPASSSLPSLVPPFISLSSSFHRQIHPGAFPSSSSSPPSFSSSPPSSSEEGLPLNMGATGAEFGRISETSLKRHRTAYLLYLLLFSFYYFCNPPSVQACLSPYLYVVRPLYINKSCYCFISHVLSLYFRNDYAVNKHTIL